MSNGGCLHITRLPVSRLIHPGVLLTSGLIARRVSPKKKLALAMYVTADPEAGWVEFEKKSHSAFVSDDEGYSGGNTWSTTKAALCSPARQATGGHFTLGMQIGFHICSRSFGRRKQKHTSAASPRQSCPSRPLPNSTWKGNPGSAPARNAYTLYRVT